MLIGIPVVPTVTTIPAGTTAGLRQLLQAPAVDTQANSVPAPPAAAAVSTVTQPPATSDPVRVTRAPLPFIGAVAEVVEAPAEATDQDDHR